MTSRIKTILAVAMFGMLALIVTPRAQEKEAAETKGEVKPLRALMVTGGCCHDYEVQKLIISTGISKRANVAWTIVHEGGGSRDHKVSIYSKADWAKGYDVIVHNECFGGVKDDAFIEGITKAHKEGTGSVALHCTAHSYRAAKTDEWRKMLGVSSYNHGPKNPIIMKNLKKDHPVMKGFPDTWTTPNGELYNIDKIWDTATPLAMGKAAGKENVCVWVNKYGKGRTFGTTIGHHNETMMEKTYLDLITRGLLWSCDKLSADGTPKPGYAPTAATK